MYGGSRGVVAIYQSPPMTSGYERRGVVTRNLLWVTGKFQRCRGGIFIWERVTYAF